MNAPANSATVEQIYKSCSVFADAYFEMERVADDKLTDVLVCVTYFTALGEFANTSCQLDNIEMNMFNIRPRYDNVNLHATIQHFVNAARDLPQYWPDEPALMVTMSILEINGECR